MALQSPYLSSRDIVLIDDGFMTLRDAALFGQDYIFVHKLETRRQRFPRQLRMAELPQWFKPRRILIPHATKVSRLDSGDGSTWDGEFLPIYVAPEQALLEARRILVSAPAIEELDSRLGVHFSDEVPSDGDQAFKVGQSRYHILQDFYIACADTTSDPISTLQELVAKTEGYRVQRTWDTNRPIRDQESLELPLSAEIDRERFFKELLARRLEEHFFWNWKLHAIVANRRDVSDLEGYPHLFPGRNWEVELSNPFAVQMLYRIRARQNGGFPADQVSPWVGTGRYSHGILPQHWRGSLAGLKGSVEIMGDLDHRLQKGRRTKRAALSNPFWSFPDGSASDRKTLHSEHIALTDHAILFLDRLHPDCEDVDLPLRLMEWLTVPDEAAEATMARYLRTWFGKLFRHNQSQHEAAHCVDSDRIGGNPAGSTN
ncbi:hypothetical protein ACD578_15925 [Microvirga sp. RSM25]|uniref:hypothetical protein n=1 Tax=Microvirga sp. RSM25 TaxID=3273802 RepID=UPI00384B1675